MLVQPITARPRQALWALGFRPFFLGGSLFALVALLLWAGELAGALQLNPAGGMLAWHRHEMLFGFAVAIVAGFLLTAVQNWSGIPGLSGRPLQGLFLLWLLGRISWFLPLPTWLLVLIEGTFLPLVALALARPIVQRRLRNNYPIVALVLLIAACQWLTLAGGLQDNELWQRRGVLAGLWLVAAMMSVIGGRVIPFFTRRGLGNMSPAPPRPWLDRACLLGSVSLPLTYVLGFNDAPQPPMALLFAALAVLHGVRLVLWHDRGLWRVPLLWSLHLAYAWLIPACLGLALWHAGVAINPSLAAHALTVGAMTGLIVAMMARVSLGHTGRPLAVPRSIGWAFALIQLAALARVVVTPFTPLGLGVSVLFGSGALLLFLWHYLPILLRPRVDGMPG
ncbi:NnrS family protein [Pseudomonas mosselii]|uniref:NnrS family protein n=1 Tax=Pseudomonas mosselii TaxID=78327 RepID=UPI00076FE7D2|nr:NnrS family protein [Pseudomonas mosselii]AMK31362.1 NnrS protein involved in response to NO [Pseudomonas putida]MBC3451489.1 NnrS family protein [Pseudomonas mosselii]MDH1659501.1 NnrS family protein [Pseudomonas mosselii]MDH1718108.1 NnrS family protein [Pseudomonas mosselii]MDH1722913.1 NnrS family protein [Pseudomonas mosselii]